TRSRRAGPQTVWIRCAGRQGRRRPGLRSGRAVPGRSGSRETVAVVDGVSDRPQFRRRTAAMTRYATASAWSATVTQDGCRTTARSGNATATHRDGTRLTMVWRAETT